MPPKVNKRQAPAAAAAPQAKRPKSTRDTTAPKDLATEAAAAAACKAAEKRDAKAVKAAIGLSRRAEFDTYHTHALWAWGADHDEWDIPR
jgi:hypothetical protein